jgi:hypothetical protein
MTDDIHTCSYYCDRPSCIERQRDWFRDRAIEDANEKAQLKELLRAWLLFAADSFIAVGDRHFAALNSLEATTRGVLEQKP